MTGEMCKDDVAINYVGRVTSDIAISGDISL